MVNNLTLKAVHLRPQQILQMGNIAVLGDATTGTLNLKLAKALTGLTSATYTDAAGNTTTVTGGSTTIADAAVIRKHWYQQNLKLKITLVYPL